MFKLTLRVPSSIPLELDGITPDRVASLSELEVARLPVLHGNRSEQLGEFFDVTTRTLPKADLQFAGDTGHVKGIAARMRGGFIHVEGNVGMHAGAQMSGGTLVVGGGAGDWLGSEMSGGTIDVRHSAGNQVGAAYRGSRRGMTGGTILIRGSAGDELGLLMRRGTIVVQGDCGEFAGASLIAGTIALLGQIGGRLGAGMKRGTIITNREPVLPPSFKFACEYRPSILHLLKEQLASIGATGSFGSGSVRCYRGDLLTGGRGEVLVTSHGS